MIRARGSTDSIDTSKSVPAPAPVLPAAQPAKALPCEPPVARERHVGAFASAVGAFGILPRAALGVSVSGQVPVSDHASFALGLTFLPEQRTTSGIGDFAFGATWGELRGCYDFGRAGPFRFAACAAALLGALHVVVSNPAPVEPGGAAWGAAALGLATDFTPTEPLHLLVRIDGLLPFQRRSYVVDSGGRSETVFVEPQWAALLSTGIGVEL